MKDKISDSRIMVSIACITYNHEKYIRDAIEGFLIQKTDFPIEIIIHDDASTDGTANIIREYGNKYPDLIKPIYQKINQYSLGIKVSPTFVWPKCRGKYTAICEGDDYWTDPYKLQKQVDYLENHPEASLCFCLANCFYEDGGEPYIFPSNVTKYDFDTEDIMKSNFIMTCSAVFRNNLIKEVPRWFYASSPLDHLIFILLSTYGKIHLISDVMCSYRIHQGGIWSMKGDRQIEKRMKDAIITSKNLNEFFNFKYDTLYKDKINGYYVTLFRHYKSVKDFRNLLKANYNYFKDYPFLFMKYVTNYSKSVIKSALIKRIP
jgi:glycosyltransferase involved in cell wall biosynthesis